MSKGVAKYGLFKLGKSGAILEESSTTTTHITSFISLFKLAGMQIKDFRMSKHLGQGAYASVKEAIHLDTGF